MSRIRVIPVLLLKNNGLYKTLKFKEPKYVGDPINAIKIFNDKEVDELIFLDIRASIENKEPDYEMLRDIASECFMPLCYGGGVNSHSIINKLLNIGVEKIALNSYAYLNKDFVREACNLHGSSTIAVSIDVKKKMLGGYSVYIKSGTFDTKLDPIEYAKSMEDLGVGELLVNSIDRDGMMNGYDLELLKKISSAVCIPVIACGGAGSMSHMQQAVLNGASAVAAGSFFVFQGKHRAVLITYPNSQEISSLI
jgi:cyclase